ncbi:MAG: PAS domain-containing protein [Thermoanaerobaculia bacterium]
MATSLTPQPDSFKMHQIQEVTAMGEEKLNALPFGAIKLDKDGTILSFNQYEAKLTGRDPNKVIGKNFFAEVAPCTNVQAFAGRYREGVAKGDLHAVFPYKFDFKMAPRDVTVTLFYSKNTQQGWVFVREN